MPRASPDPVVLGSRTSYSVYEIEDGLAITATSSLRHLVTALRLPANRMGEQDKPTRAAWTMHEYEKLEEGPSCLDACLSLGAGLDGLASSFRKNRMAGHYEKWLVWRRASSALFCPRPRGGWTSHHPLDNVAMPRTENGMTDDEELS